MSTCTVRFDDEAEKNLEEIRKSTGLSISSVLKQGLMAYREKLAELAPPTTPYALYESLDLGPGGYALVPSTDSREGMRRALAKQRWR